MRELSHPVNDNQETIVRMVEAAGVEPAHAWLTFTQKPTVFEEFSTFWRHGENFFVKQDETANVSSVRNR